MDILERFFAALRQRHQSVVLPEGTDSRVVAAACRLRDEGIARPILLGPLAQIDQTAAEARLDTRGLERVDPESSAHFEQYVQAYAQRRDVKEGIAAPHAQETALLRRHDGRPRRRRYHGGRSGSRHGHGHPGGALYDRLRPGIETVSSFFLMVLPQFRGQPDQPLIFADCAVTVDPSAAQLADIALASHASAGDCSTDTPRVHFLSFATLGSAAHPLVDKVTGALAIVKQRDPGALIDGEFQLDAACPGGGGQESQTSQRGGGTGQRAGVSRPEQREHRLQTDAVPGRRAAIGPFLQGFAKPISDLSRERQCR